MRNLTTGGTSAALLLALGAAACGEDKVLAPEESVVQDSVSAALADADLLADPFVNLLIGSLKDAAAADAIRVALGQLAAGAELTNLAPLVEELVTENAAESETGADAEDIVALTALGLLLESAGEVRNAARPDEGPLDRSQIRRPR